MLFSKWLRAGAALTAAAGTLSGALVGCGGGGGGGGGGGTQPIPGAGRSYVFNSGSISLSISIDNDGRFTIVQRDSNVAGQAFGGQGTVAPGGQFVAATSDGQVQFSGSVAANGSTVTGQVIRGGTTIVPAYTATLVTAGTASPAALIGTHSSTQGASSLFVTFDATSHASLWAVTNGTSGGGLLNVAPSGELTSTDNQTAGTVTTGSSPALTLTKLAGQTVNVTFNLTRVTRARWTFMVFLNAANDLQEFGPLNVNQMEKVGSTSDVNMVVQWKQANCFRCGNPDWIGTRRYHVKKDNNTSQIGSTLIQDMGPSIDMGDWRELRNFILWSQQNYPADRYALVIWNHGAGWRKTREGKLKDFPRSVSIDDSTNTEIQTWELPQALNVTPKMDLLIFDASLMQMTEVLYEVRNSTPIVVGSEESPPGEGYVYDTFLQPLVDNPAMTSRQFATNIVNKTLDAYGNNNNLTQSAVDTSKMQGVADALSVFGNTLTARLAGNQEALRNARLNAENYAYPENKDLWDYAELVKNATSHQDLKTAATNVQSAIAAATFAERHGTLHSRSRGMSIYVPSPTNYLSNYSSLAIARATSWPQWLQTGP